MFQILTEQDCNDELRAAVRESILTDGYGPTVTHLCSIMERDAALRLVHEEYTKLEEADDD